MLVILTKPVHADSFPTKYLVSALSINPLVNIVSSVYSVDSHVIFKPMGDSKAEGEAQIFENSDSLSTQVSLNFWNLEPSAQYIAVYHHNHECEIEIDTLDNVIQGAFIASDLGKGKVEDRVKDRIYKINSISLRTAGNFKEVFACAKV